MMEYLRRADYPGRYHYWGNERFYCGVLLRLRAILGLPVQTVGSAMDDLRIQEISDT